VTAPAGIQGDAAALVSTAEATLAEVREAMGHARSPRTRDVDALRDELRALHERLRESCQDATDLEPAELAHRLELLSEVGRLGHDLVGWHISRQLEVIASVHEALARLREHDSPERLIEAAPRELCLACGFTRAMISRVHGSSWVPEALEVMPGTDEDEAGFRTYVEQAEIPLGHMLLETELVRRRMPSLVTDPVGDPRTFKEIVGISRSSSYVVAPIMPTGRVIGFLHADRYGEDEPVTADDRDHLWAFAEHFGFIFERAVLVERLAAQRREVSEAFGLAETALDELHDAEIALARREPDAPEVARTGAAIFRRGDSRLEGLLTAREREVLELMAGGATNTQIAEQLVIGEGTVKSHVKHILRKLRVSNRAEAVSRYLRLMMRRQGGEER
jgi:DNA-binding CsgD family transcriptional regulator